MTTEPMDRLDWADSDLDEAFAFVQRLDEASPVPDEAFARSLRASVLAAGVTRRADGPTSVNTGIIAAPVAIRMPVRPVASPAFLLAAAGAIAAMIVFTAIIFWTGGDSHSAIATASVNAIHATQTAVAIGTTGTASIQP